MSPWIRPDRALAETKHLVDEWLATLVFVETGFPVRLPKFRKAELEFAQELVVSGFPLGRKTVAAAMASSKAWGGGLASGQGAPGYSGGKMTDRATAEVVGLMVGMTFFRNRAGDVNSGPHVLFLPSRDMLTWLQSLKLR